MFIPGYTRLSRLAYKKPVVLKIDCECGETHQINSVDGDCLCRLCTPDVIERYVIHAYGLYRCKYLIDFLHNYYPNFYVHERCLLRRRRRLYVITEAE